MRAVFGLDMLGGMREGGMRWSDGAMRGRVRVVAKQRSDELFLYLYYRGYKKKYELYSPL